MLLAVAVNCAFDRGERAKRRCAHGHSEGRGTNREYCELTASVTLSRLLPLAPPCAGNLLREAFPFLENAKLFEIRIIRKEAIRDDTDPVGFASFTPGDSRLPLTLLSDGRPAECRALRFHDHKQV